MRTSMQYISLIILLCYLLQSTCLFNGHKNLPISRIVSTPRSINGGNGLIPPRGPSILFNGENENENISKPLLNWSSLSEDTKNDIKTTAISFAFALFIRVFLIEPRYIPSLSMFPTFEVGDQLIVDKISHIRREYKKRDVVVFNPSQAYIDLTGNTEALIKRIVAVAGDTVEVKNKKVYVNGVAQEEPYINERPDYDFPPTQVPEGMVLVLGDNRNRSYDSHIWGFLPEKNIIGRAVLKYWPPWRVGFVEGST